MDSWVGAEVPKPSREGPDKSLQALPTAKLPQRGGAGGSDGLLTTCSGMEEYMGGQMAPGGWGAGCRPEEV